MIFPATCRTKVQLATQMNFSLNISEFFPIVAGVVGVFRGLAFPPSHLPQGGWATKLSWMHNCFGLSLGVAGKQKGIQGTQRSGNPGIHVKVSPPSSCCINKEAQIKFEILLPQMLRRCR